jgi:hypothetical protein
MLLTFRFLTGLWIAGTCHWRHLNRRHLPAIKISIRPWTLGDICRAWPSTRSSRRWLRCSG